MPDLRRERTQREWYELLKRQERNLVRFDLVKRQESAIICDLRDHLNELLEDKP